MREHFTNERNIFIHYIVADVHFWSRADIVNRNESTSNCYNSAMFLVFFALHRLAVMRVLISLCAIT